MNTCEICGQRVETPNNSTTQYYIPWCENRIKELEDQIKEAQKKILVLKIDLEKLLER